ncbi:hypothetical protein W97_02142 [Coniosporium apollinis CBS 100218]|uniref:Uncharacterized protein n=1 Tax=Coniosporium apollinis (strain CBS 100218) TaxID=1168221 RepID=R7YMM9_CONA1|nr:uncharacterized protein W97_02142 [Coniosporium apollinis CBS 100218]EON62916.1 hypothetical protein W97_02142 [Coniosporium apollinis CBS 100218]
MLLTPTTFHTSNYGPMRPHLHTCWRTQSPSPSPPQQSSPPAAFVAKRRKPQIKGEDIVPGAMLYLSSIKAQRCPALWSRLVAEDNIQAVDHPVFVVEKNGTKADIMIATSYTGRGLGATADGVRDYHYHFSVASTTDKSDMMQAGNGEKMRVFLADGSSLKRPTCIRVVRYTIEWRLLERYMVDNKTQDMRLEASSVERLHIAAQTIEESNAGGPLFAYEHLPPLPSHGPSLASLIKKAGGIPTFTPATQ